MLAESPAELLDAIFYKLSRVFGLFSRRSEGSGDADFVDFWISVLDTRAKGQNMPNL
jgi:hypothetical protein